ncbi:MAG: DUF3352 domain-containing protein [Candidatus Eremiobacterota bacterium]
MSFYKFNRLLIALLTLLLLSSCIISDYEDTVKIIPKDAEIICNINLSSFFKRRAIVNGIYELSKDPDTGKFFDHIKELLSSVILASSPSEELDAEKDLLPYLNTNCTIAFYNTLHKLDSSFFKKDRSQEALNFIIVFDIRDKQGITEFLARLNYLSEPKKGNYKGQNFFTGKNSSYFMNEQFLVFANTEILLKASIDCSDGNFSITGEENFRTFREKKMSDEAIGFVYYNVPAISEEFSHTFTERNNFHELLESVKYMGTSIEVDKDKVKFNSFLVQNDRLTETGREFFSLHATELSSPDMLPVTSSAVIVISQPGEILNKISSIFKTFLPGNLEGIAKIFSTAGYPVNDILSSNKETALSFITDEDSRDSPEHSGNYIIAMKFEKDSPLTKTFSGSGSIFSMVTKTARYKDISITSLPGSTGNFSMVNDFLLLGTGKKPLEAVIDTYSGDEDSIEERITTHMSTRSVGLIYLRLDKIYNNSIDGLMKNENLREKLQETFEHYPEIWGNINRVEDGYSSTLIMPI